MGDCNDSGEYHPPYPSYEEYSNSYPGAIVGILFAFVTLVILVMFFRCLDKVERQPERNTSGTDK